jgi:APA family basic amino acid/polyamine antiporter
MVVGEVIAVGIFLTPAEMAKALGSPLRILLVWSAVGLAAFCGALCYGELAARYPEAGGGYVYLREAWGPGVAFLYGWKSLLVMDPGITAALAAGLAQYAGALIPLSALEAKGVAMLAIVLIGIVHVLGVGLGAGLLRGLTVLKLILLAAIVMGGFVSGRGDWSHFVPLTVLRAGSPPAMAGLAAGVVAAFFSFGGFWDAAKLAGEVKDPVRTLPRALALGVAVVTLVYMATSAVFIYLVPIEGASSGAAFAAQVGEVLLGATGARGLSAVVVIAVLGSLAAVLLGAPRVYYAMARDGVFLRSVAAIHPRLRTPARAIGVQMALACLLVALGSFEDIVAYFVFITIAFVALTVAGLYRLPRPAAGAYRVPGYPVTPLGFLALLAVLLVLLAAGRPVQAALGTAVVALGIPVYRLIVAAHRRLPAVGAPLEES